MVEMPAVTASSLALITSSRARHLWRLAWSWASSRALGAALPGRVVVAQLEVVGIGQLQDEADAAVLHGEDDGGQVALGRVGEAVGAVPVQGLFDLVAGAVDGDGGVASVGDGVYLEDAADRSGLGTV